MNDANQSRIIGQEALTKVAAIQMKPDFGEPEANLRRTCDLIEEAAARGAEIIVLPELCVSGYVFNTRREVAGLSESIPQGPSVTAWTDIARQRGVFVVGGVCERDGDTYYNSAAVVGPSGYLGTYRKTHLFFEEKMFFESGNLGFPIFQLPMGKIGVLICYDLRFPEPARILALQGVDLICSPTNWVALFNSRLWDDRGYCMANYIVMGSAAVNQVFFACADRVGVERGVQFLGASLIVGPSGWPMAGPASKDQEEIMLAEVNLSEARRSKAKNEFNHTLLDRRTDLYHESLGYVRNRPQP